MEDGSLMSVVGIDIVELETEYVKKLRSQQPTVFYQLRDRPRKRQSCLKLDMAESHVTPPSFCGRRDDDADSFLKAFDRYVKYREISDKKKQLNLFAVLLKENAANWLDSLPETSTDCFDNLMAAFTARYQSPESIKFKCANELFTKKQADGESVDEYVAEMRKLARLISVDDSLLQLAVINGFKPYISAHVMQARPDTVDKILDVARLAELTMPKMSMMASESAICQQLAEMQADMRGLSIKVDKAMTTSIRSRSPTPERRVRFARSESPGTRAPEPPTIVQHGRRENTWRRPGFQRDAYSQQHRGQYQSTTPCDRCARSHGKQSFCPARDPSKVCFFCRKPGHFQAACFSAPKQH